MFGFYSRPIGRLFLLLSLLVTVTMRAQAPPLTTVQDTVYEADGTPAQGTLLISWSAFTTASGQAVAAGSTSTTLGTGGALSIGLVSNANATPVNTIYTVVYQTDVVKTEYWIVPTTSPATLAEVRTTLGTSTAPSQLVTQQYVNAAVATKANDSAVVHNSGNETISGVKQFSSPPSVPVPAQSGDAVNKQYVDNSVQNNGSGSYLSTSGGTMTGALVLAGDPMSANQAADKHYADMLAAVKADLIAGLVPPTELGSGTPGASTCLLGNQTWGTCGTGGGSSSYINSILIANPNFNAFAPPAQSGFLNCSFQNANSNVSLECPYGASSSAFALGSQTVLNNQSNAYSAGVQDFSVASLKLPSGTGYMPAASGEIGYDTTANMPVINVNGTTQQLALTTSNISGQASTALALAATPAQCNGSFATGIQANGNANCSVADVLELAETSQPAGIPNYGIFWFDSATHTPRIIDNNGQVAQLSLMNVFNSDANTLQEYNGTNPQEFDIYGTRPDSSDYERMRLGYGQFNGSTYFFIGPDSAGSGQQRGLAFFTATSPKWVIDGSSIFKPWTTNAYDIGTSTQEVRNLYLGTGLIFGSGTLTGVHGTTGVAAEAGALGTAAGAGLCNDGNGNVTDSGCTTGAVGSVFGRTGTVTAQSGDYSVAQVTGAAPLVSPALTGTPTAPTQSAGDSSAKLATTAFVGSAIASTPSANGYPTISASGADRGAAIHSTWASHYAYGIDATGEIINESSTQLNVSSNLFPVAGAYLPSGSGDPNYLGGVFHLPTGAIVSAFPQQVGENGVTIQGMGSSASASSTYANATFFLPNTSFNPGTGTSYCSFVFAFGVCTGWASGAGVAQFNTGPFNTHLNDVIIDTLAYPGLSGLSFTGQENSGTNSITVQNARGVGVFLNGIAGNLADSQPINGLYLRAPKTNAVEANTTPATISAWSIRSQNGVGLASITWSNTPTATPAVGQALVISGTSGGTGGNGGSINGTFIVGAVVDASNNVNVLDARITGYAGTLSGPKQVLFVVNTSKYAVGSGGSGGTASFYTTGLYANGVVGRNLNNLSVVSNLADYGNGIMPQFEVLMDTQATGITGAHAEEGVDGFAWGVTNNSQGNEIHVATPTTNLTNSLHVYNNGWAVTSNTYQGCSSAANGVTNSLRDDIHNITLTATNNPCPEIIFDGSGTVWITAASCTEMTSPAGTGWCRTGTQAWTYYSAGVAQPLTLLAGVSAPVITSTVATGTAPFTVSSTTPVANLSIGGTAANLSGTPALPNGTTATTQSAGDNSTKLATTAYVDTEIGASLPFIPFNDYHTIAQSSIFPTAANKANVVGLMLNRPITTSKFVYKVGGTDSTNTYGVGLYNASGMLVLHYSSPTFAASGVYTTANWVEGSTTLAAGKYYLMFTSNCASSCATFTGTGTNAGSFYSNTSFSVTTGGTLPGSITPPANSESFGAQVLSMIWE